MILGKLMVCVAKLISNFRSLLWGVQSSPVVVILLPSILAVEVETREHVHPPEKTRHDTQFNQVPTGLLELLEAIFEEFY
jgi:hypothetical protein